MRCPPRSLSRVPLVVWVHNFALPPSVRYLGWLWRLVLPRADVRWAAVSPLARDLAVDAGLARADDVTIVPNPIDPGDVVATERRTGATGRSVAYLGAPRRYKGFDLLPDIVDASPSEVADADWLVFSRQTRRRPRRDVAPSCARWPTMAACRSRASSPTSAASTPGATSSCARRCSSSFCRVAAEAMLNGIPVVGSDLPPIRALLGDDEAGLLVPGRRRRSRGDGDRSPGRTTQLCGNASVRRGGRRAAAYDPGRSAGRLLGCTGSRSRRWGAHRRPRRPRARRTIPGQAAPEPGEPSSAPRPMPPTVRGREGRREWCCVRSRARRGGRPATASKRATSSRRMSRPPRARSPTTAARRAERGGGWLGPSPGCRRATFEEAQHRPVRRRDRGSGRGSATCSDGSCDESLVAQLVVSLRRRAPDRPSDPPYHSRRASRSPASSASSLVRGWPSPTARRRDRRGRCARSEPPGTCSPSAGMRSTYAGHLVAVARLARCSAA